MRQLIAEDKVARLTHIIVAAQRMLLTVMRLQMFRKLIARTCI